MPIFDFENKETKHKRRIREFGTKIGQEAAKNFKYDPESDPVLANLRKKLGLHHSKKRGKS